MARHNDGLVLIGFSASDATATSVALDAGGNVVVAGGASDSIGVARLTPAGALDTTFNSTGTPGQTTVSTNGTFQNTAVGVAVQADRSIVVAGTQFDGVANDDFQVSRLTATGAPDTSFNSTGGTPGTTTTQFGSGDAQGSAVAIQAGRQYRRGGRRQSAPARGTPNFQAARYIGGTGPNAGSSTPTSTPAVRNRAPRRSASPTSRAASSPTPSRSSPTARSSSPAAPRADRSPV